MRYNWFRKTFSSCFTPIDHLTKLEVSFTTAVVPCLNVTCLNGACTITEDGNKGYCLCPEGFTGTQCESKQVKRAEVVLLDKEVY